MNVREMLEEIPRRYPQHRLLTPNPRDLSPDVNWFKLHLENSWSISCTYGRLSYSDGRFRVDGDSQNSTSVEIAIFTPDPNGDWFIAEGMVVSEYEGEPKSGVLTWQTSNQLFAVIDYVAQFDPKPLV